MKASSTSASTGRARQARMGCGFVRAITALFLKHRGGILYVHGE